MVGPLPRVGISWSQVELEAPFWGFDCQPLFLKGGPGDKFIMQVHLYCGAGLSCGVGFDFACSVCPSLSRSQAAKGGPVTHDGVQSQKSRTALGCTCYKVPRLSNKLRGFIAKLRGFSAKLRGQVPAGGGQQRLHLMAARCELRGLVPD